MCLRKNMYSSVIGWSILYMYIRFIWLIVLIKSSISLFIFCQLLDPLLKVGVLKCLPL